LNDLMAGQLVAGVDDSFVEPLTSVIGRLSALTLFD
jgi:hypothetical protein